jgi:hypothetical protein
LKNNIKNIQTEYYENIQKGKVNENDDRVPDIYVANHKLEGRLKDSQRENEQLRAAIRYQFTYRGNIHQKNRSCQRENFQRTRLPSNAS